MTQTTWDSPGQGVSLRMAALIAGVGLLIMVVTAPVAEFYIFPKLFVDGDITATSRNILENRTLFMAGAFGHFITLTCDIFVAWALYILLRPVNPAVSLLAAIFRLVYTVIAFVALFNLFTAYKVLSSPEYAAAVSPEQVSAQAHLLLNSFDFIWNSALIIFGMYLFIIGLLIIAASYIPSLIGAAVSIAGLGYVLYYAGAYISPKTDLGFLFFTFFGELIFMLWLLIAGWRLKAPEGY